MNKAFLLTFCLLFASFTGCVDNSEDNDDLTSEIEKLTEENKDLNELLANQTGNNDALTSESSLPPARDGGEMIDGENAEDKVNKLIEKLKMEAKVI